MNEWDDLFVATAGASAALTGLIFVGVSINLSRILSYPKLPSRALFSLILLVAILILSILMLIPGQALCTAGYETLLTGACTWLFALFIGISIIKKTDKQYKYGSYFNLLINLLAVSPYIIAAIFLLSGNANGAYWLIAAFIFSIIKSIADAWVLLIEINR